MSQWSTICTCFFVNCEVSLYKVGTKGYMYIYIPIDMLQYSPYILCGSPFSWLYKDVVSSYIYAYVRGLYSTYVYYTNQSIHILNSGSTATEEPIPQGCYRPWNSLVLQTNPTFRPFALEKSNPDQTAAFIHCAGVHKNEYEIKCTIPGDSRNSLNSRLIREHNWKGISVGFQP